MMVIFESCTVLINKEKEETKLFFDTQMEKINENKNKIIVVTNNEHKCFEDAIVKYDRLVGSQQIGSTNNESGIGYGKIISGVLDGKETDVIVYKESVIKGFLYKNVLCSSIVFHEIGHSVFNEILKNMGYMLNDKIYYNIEVEEEKYLYDASLCCIDEFLAQSFSYKTLIENNNILDELIDSNIIDLSTFCFNKRMISNYENIHSILYQFSVLYIGLYLVKKTDTICDHIKTENENILECLKHVGKAFDILLKNFNKEGIDACITAIKTSFIELFLLLKQV